MARKAMGDAPSAFEPLLARSNAPDSMQLANQMVLLAWRAPWEQERQNRLLKLVCAGQLKALETPLWRVPQRTSPPTRNDRQTPDYVPARSWAPPTPDLATWLSAGKLNGMISVNLFQDFLVASPSIRGSDALMQQALQTTRIRLALDLYKAENGIAAKLLGDLVPKYLAEVPVDPLSGLAYTIEEMTPKDGAAIGGAGR
jgi:hypothetical protein